MFIRQMYVDQMSIVQMSFRQNVNRPNDVEPNRLSHLSKKKFGFRQNLKVLKKLKNEANIKNLFLHLHSKDVFVYSLSFPIFVQIKKQILLNHLFNHCVHLSFNQNLTRPLCTVHITKKILPY
jgi:hypothetical protein